MHPIPPPPQLAHATKGIVRYRQKMMLGTSQTLQLSRAKLVKDHPNPGALRGTKRRSKGVGRGVDCPRNETFTQIILETVATIRQPSPAAVAATI